MTCSLVRTSSHNCPAVSATPLVCGQALEISGGQRDPEFPLQTVDDVQPVDPHSSGALPVPTKLEEAPTGPQEPDGSERDAEGAQHPRERLAHRRPPFSKLVPGAHSAPQARLIRLRLPRYQTPDPATSAPAGEPGRLEFVGPDDFLETAALTASSPSPAGPASSASPTTSACPSKPSHSTRPSRAAAEVASASSTSARTGATCANLSVSSVPAPAEGNPVESLQRLRQHPNSPSSSPQPTWTPPEPSTGGCGPLTL